MLAEISVCDRIVRLCREHHSRTALEEFPWDAGAGEYHRGRSVTYAQLYEQTLRLADALATRGVHPGDRVAVLLPNSIELVVSEWACLLTGMVWVALNERSSATEQAAILGDCSPSVVLLAERHRELAMSMALPSSCLVVVVSEDGDWPALLASGRVVAPPSEPQSEDVVRIRYTSGTAGLPKGAVLARRCYDASVVVVTEVIGPLQACDVVAQVAPMTHAAGAMWPPHAVVGAKALLLDRFDAAAFVRLAERENVTSVFLVPTMLLRFLEAVAASEKALTGLRSIVYGGASMPADRLERGLELLGPVFVQIYGLTESNWPVTALRREDHTLEGSTEQRRQRLASCGRPTSVGELRIVRADGRDAAPGVAGEILVRGRNTMLGYWGKGHSLDAKGLDEEGWMHTGDVAVCDEDGFVTVVDRLHDMIVSGGFNVYPREVEDALSSHPAVLESAVVGRADVEWGERVHAVVVLRANAKVQEDELARHVAQRTAPYKKPRSFEFVAELPKNAAGKVLRRALKTTTPPA